MEIIKIIVDTFTQFLTGLVQGIVSVADGIIYTTNSSGEKEMTTLFIVILVFGAISIGFTIVKWVMGLVHAR